MVWGFSFWCHVFFVCNYLNTRTSFLKVSFPVLSNVKTLLFYWSPFISVLILMHCQDTYKLGSSLVEKFFKKIGLFATLQILWLRLYMLVFFFFVTIEKAMLADCFISPGGSPKRLPCYYITEAGLKQRDFPENISIAAHFFFSSYRLQFSQ